MKQENSRAAVYGLLLSTLTLVLLLSYMAYEKFSRPWRWDGSYPQQFDASRLSRKISFISVQGNHFVDESGKTIVFRGVNISDPDSLEHKVRRWNKQHFEVLKSWGANAIRIPVHPIVWNELGQERYFKFLDQAVIWANELDLYLIIDWHAIGNLKTGLFQHKQYETNLQNTMQFWRSVSFRYANIPTIAFYEIFNEPTDYSGKLGTLTWDEWKQINEDIIRIIFANNKKVIPLVGGFNWAYDLTPVRNNPISIEGIGYACHPYPGKAKPPYAEKWERDFGFVADKYPLILTEIGFMPPTDPGAHNPAIGDESYGKAIVEYCDKKGISWMVWVFDQDWPPQMFSDWNYTPTLQGAFFKKVMTEKNHAGQ